MPARRRTRRHAAAAVFSSPGAHNVRACTSGVAPIGRSSGAQKPRRRSGGPHRAERLGDGVDEGAHPGRALQTLRADGVAVGLGGVSHVEMMPADGLDALRGQDAILLGSAGGPHFPDHITPWGLRLKICQGFDQQASVRPTRVLPGIDAPLKRCRPEDLNWVNVRENAKGEHSGVGGHVHQGPPIEAASDVSIMTRAGVERILRFAFKPAQGWRASS